MYFSFADRTSANHYIQTSSDLFNYYIWYYVVASADYSKASYSVYIYEGDKDGSKGKDNKLKYSKTLT